MNLGKGRIIRLNQKAPSCPLCRDNKNAHEHFMEREYILLRNLFVYKCDTYMVAIACDDKMVGRWDAALEASGKIECPACNADMRFFSTSTGFVKGVCPKKGCGATMSNAEPDRPKVDPLAGPLQ